MDEQEKHLDSEGNPLKDTHVREDGKTVLVNACGHEFPYKINRPSAVGWLQGRPCPRCQASWQKGKPRADKAPKAPKAPEAPKAPKMADIEREAENKGPQDDPKPFSEGAGADALPEKPKRKAPTSAAVKAILEGMPSVPAGAHHAAFVDVALAVSANVPVWLQGPPGTSKSTLAVQVADALGLGFYPVSCHELQTESALLGYRDAVGKDHRTPLWDAYENGGVCLLDEVDNGNPNLLAVLNSALSNGHCVFGGGTIVQRHADFRVIATANTAGLGPESGFIGRNGVDLATRDRFVTVAVPVDTDLERYLAGSLLGEDVSALLKSIVNRSENRRKVRAESAAAKVDSQTLYDAVLSVRANVESRYRGSVVSPRTTIHAAALTGVGFTLREALASKLPGLTPEDADIVLRSVKA